MLPGTGTPVWIVAGGARRQDSVANAFRAAGETTDIIVIHDAARPFASAELIARTIAAAAESGAAVAAVQSRDTVKRADRVPAASGRTVLETIPRDTIYLAQTPQAFRREVLRRALEIGARDWWRRPTRPRWSSSPACRCGSSTARRRTSRSRRPTTWCWPRRSPRGEASRTSASAHSRNARRRRHGPAAPAPATICIGWSPAGR